MDSTIGKQLYEARLRRGLVLEDVQHKTRIPVGRLIALENDDYSGFGSPAYARSFLALYGRFLKVDVSETLRAIQLNGADTARECGNSAPGAGSIAKRAPRVRYESGRQLRLAWVALVLAGLIGLVVWYGNRHGRQQSDVGPQKTETLSSAQPMVAARSAPSPIDVAALAHPGDGPHQSASIPGSDSSLTGPWRLSGEPIPVLKAHAVEATEAGGQSPRSTNEIRRAIENPRSSYPVARAGFENR
jgi:cytoskeletal protein RodZ